MLLFEKASGARGCLFNNLTTRPFLSETPLAFHPKCLTACIWVTPNAGRAPTPGHNELKEHLCSSSMLEALRETGIRRMRRWFVLLRQGLLFPQERKESKVMLPVLGNGSYQWCIPVSGHLTVGIKVYQNLKEKRQVKEHSSYLAHRVSHTI